MGDVTKAQVKARVRLIRNGVNIYDQVFDSGKDDFTESAQQRIVLGTSTTEQVNLAGVTTGAKLMVITDRDIKVAVNNATYLVPVSDVMIMTSDGITGLWLKNESAVFTATVTIVVTD